MELRGGCSTDYLNLERTEAAVLSDGSSEYRIKEKVGYSTQVCAVREKSSGDSIPIRHTHDRRPDSSDGVCAMSTVHVCRLYLHTVLYRVHAYIAILYLEYVLRFGKIIIRLKWGVR